MVVRAVTSHHCGPGLIPGPGVQCGLSWFLVLVLTPRVFSLGRLLSLPLQKTNVPNFSIPAGTSGLEEPPCGMSTHLYNYYINNNNNNYY